VEVDTLTEVFPKPSVNEPPTLVAFTVITDKSVNSSLQEPFVTSTLYVVLVVGETEKVISEPVPVRAEPTGLSSESSRS
jgi:hypothetical protein